MIEVAALAASPEGSPPVAAITALLTGKFRKFRCHRRQLIVLAARPPVLNLYVLNLKFS